MLVRIVSVWCIVTSSLLLSSPSIAQDQRCPSQLYASGFDGKPLGGSKQRLIDAVQRGEAIRIGWDIDFDEDGESDLSHWADAEFLSVWEGEVFTQVTAIHRQRPIRGEGEVRLPGPFTEWRGLLGTNGLIMGSLSDSEPGAGRSVQMFWCAARPIKPTWTPVYKNGRNGEALEGSKKRLFAAIRAGHPIQIGWGLARDVAGAQKSVEHIVSPVFLTIVDGQEISAQLPEHIAAKSYWDIDQALFDEPAVMWRGMLTSKGVFDAVWVNRATGSIVRRAPQRAVMTWYVQDVAPQSTPSLAIPDGVTADPERRDDRLPQ